MSEWKEKDERGALWTMHFMHWLCKHHFERLIHVLLYPIAAYFLFTSSEVRKASASYFMHLKGSFSWMDHYKQLMCFAKSLVDRVLILMGEGHSFEVQTEGREMLIEAQNRGHGGILLGAHIGNFEAGSAFAKNKTALNIHIVTNNEQSKKVRAILDDVNPEMGKRMIDLGQSDAIFKMRDVIEAGGLLAILADRTDGEKVIKVSFLDDEIELPAGPYLLASALKCPVFCFFALRVGNHQYRSYAVKLADKIELPRRAGQEEIEVYAQKYADILESFVRQYPYHWFNFFEYWAGNRDESI